MAQGKNYGRDSLRVPQLVIPLEVWQKMMAYILNCPVEINGFGFVSLRGNVITVEDVFILDQVVSGVSAETVQESLDAYVHELTRSGGNPGAIKFQWHSHVKMTAVFSTTDTQNIARWPGDWLVSLVANHRGEYSCQLDMKRPLGVTLPLQPLIPMSVSSDLGQQVRSDIARHVRQQRLLGGTKPAKHALATDSGPLWGDPDDFVMFDQSAVR